MFNLSLRHKAYSNIRGSSGVVLALHDHNVFCVLIPKVACSTLTAIVVDLLGFQLPEGCWKPGVFRGVSLDKFIDVKLRNAAKLNLHDTKKIRGYWGFAIVRNPYDRLVSCYSEKIRDDAPEALVVNGVSKALCKYRVFRRGMSFKEFANEIVKINDVWADPHFRSQSSFIYTWMGKQRVDYIGHIETIKDDLLIISKKLNVPPFNIPHLLKSDRKEWQSYYTPALKELVYKRYKKDFDLLGYDK